MLFLFSLLLSLQTFDKTNNLEFLNPISKNELKYVKVYLGTGFEYTGIVNVPSSYTVKELLSNYKNNYDNTKLINYDIDTAAFNNMKLVIQPKPTLVGGVASNSIVKNLRFCSIDDFMKAKGVGSKIANQIFEYVKLHSDIQKAEDLDVIKGVGVKTITEIKKYCD